MTTIKLIKELPPHVSDKAALHTARMSDFLFQWEDKLWGGVARQSLLEAPELWVWVDSEFRPRDLFRLRDEFASKLTQAYPYIRARVEVSRSKAAKFAFAFGFMYEETVGPWHWFSMRA